MLTGDRPTGKLHIGHYVGSLRQRLEIQKDPEFDKMFIMIADAQALTDNAENPQKVRESVMQVAMDYLAIGIDPSKTSIMIQSLVPQLHELTMYYMNLVTVSRVQRNPTIKSEIQMRGFGDNIPMGFFNYPVSQASDITAFMATTVPVGADAGAVPGNRAPLQSRVRRGADRAGNLSASEPVLHETAGHGRPGENE